MIIYWCVGSIDNFELVTHLLTINVSSSLNDKKSSYINNVADIDRMLSSY